MLAAGAGTMALQSSSWCEQKTNRPHVCNDGELVHVTARRVVQTMQREFSCAIGTGSSTKARNAQTPQLVDFTGKVAVDVWLECAYPCHHAHHLSRRQVSRTPIGRVRHGVVQWIDTAAQATGINGLLRFAAFGKTHLVLTDGLARRQVKLAFALALFTNAASGAGRTADIVGTITCLGGAYIQSGAVGKQVAILVVGEQARTAKGRP